MSGLDRSFPSWGVPEWSFPDPQLDVASPQRWDVVACISFQLPRVSAAVRPASLRPTFFRARQAARARLWTRGPELLFQSMTFVRVLRRFSFACPEFAILFRRPA